MRIQTLTIVGVGLIGGSIGLAAKRRGVAERVIGAGRNSASLERARALGAVDEALLDLSTAVHQADVAVFCTPVDRVVEQVLGTASGCKAGALLTDAGSTKEQIVRGIETRLPRGVAFVGSHPLAGSEKRGPEHADADLFQGRLTIITRTAQTDPTALERTAGFWQALGSHVRIMSPQEHDWTLALTSHLPHLVAAALADILPTEAYPLTATGFRDTTRVAAGDPALWTAIFGHNRHAVLSALVRFEEKLAGFRKTLEAGDWTSLQNLLSHAKKVRDALGN
jgi:prephenate dehydrogenase